MSQVAKALSSREISLARRKALSSGGKAAIKGTQGSTVNTSAAGRSSNPVTQPAPVMRTSSSVVTANSTRAASLARRKAMSTRGKVASNSQDRTRTGDYRTAAKNAPVDTAVINEKTVTGDGVTAGCGCGCNGKEKTCQTSSGLDTRTARKRIKRRPSAAESTAKTAALARRKALSARGKAGLGSSMSNAQAVKASNPEMTGRELARALREQKSRRGNAGQKKSVPSGRQRPARKVDVGAAQDAPWKVGASDTSHGQTVTGTMVGRSHSVTGDEASACRPVTGTEYMGADIFRDFCQTEAPKSSRRVEVSPTRQGNQVTGNKVGRSSMVTGDEPGTCKNVTGTEYIGADQSMAYCGTALPQTTAGTSQSATQKGKKVTGDNVDRADKVTGGEAGANRQLTGSQYMQLNEGNAPAKVGVSSTLRGGSVTGTMVGRSQRMTGDEPGSCRNVTGDDYLGQEQFKEFCTSTPRPEDKKVGASKTFHGETVTGTMTGRSGRVTGDEPGTCKAVTGTPYAGLDQYQGFCKTAKADSEEERLVRQPLSAGAPMTGLQPSVAGNMTGDSKGACEAVSGTPYIGADQFAQACPGTAAEPGSPDFPQSLGDVPWGGFSVVSPAKAMQSDVESSLSAVTGSHYEQGQITGPFGMAAGKVTGTEDARFGKSSNVDPVLPKTAETVDGRVMSRITGEGMDAGTKITGDDWDRGDRVTGTEGASAVKRNPTLRGGPMSAVAAMQLPGRNQDVPEPVSKVTGGSGNTDRGALITYSGGARG
jgi:hypothetical protein